MYRRFVQRIAPLLLTLGLLAPAAPPPALAARGGGCSTDDAKISSCISYSRGNVIGDFYMNAYYDRSVYYAYIQIRTTNTGNSRWYGPYTLNRNGRFGPVSKGVTTLRRVLDVHLQGSTSTQAIGPTTTTGTAREFATPELYMGAFTTHTHQVKAKTASARSLVWLKHILRYNS